MRRMAWTSRTGVNQRKAARAGEMLQVLWACDRITGQKVMFEAHISVTVIQDRRARRRQQLLRLP